MTEVAVIMVEESTQTEELGCRHRKERKELQAKIQALKKSASKNDKKKRKEVMEVVTRLEKDLELRHKQELRNSEPPQQQILKKDVVKAKEGVELILAAEIKKCDISPPEAEETKIPEDEVITPQPRISKAQKRREKKEKEARQRAEEIKAASYDAKLAPRAIESKKIITKLNKVGLTLFEVPSDGDCLYNAVRHQLLHHGLGSHSVTALRCETANYIQANKALLINYMTNPNTDETLNDEEFEKYCEAVRSTPAWGGQVELKALSSVLKVPIEVLQAEGPPTLHGAEEFEGPNLTITYHRLMFSLGEHYNSTITLSEMPTEEEL